MSSIPYTDPVWSATIRIRMNQHDAPAFGFDVCRLYLARLPVLSWTHARRVELVVAVPWDVEADQREMRYQSEFVWNGASGAFHLPYARWYEGRWWYYVPYRAELWERCVGLTADIMALHKQFRELCLLAPEQMERVGLSFLAQISSHGERGQN